GPERRPQVDVGAAAGAGVVEVDLLSYEPVHADVVDLQRRAELHDVEQLLAGEHHVLGADPVDGVPEAEERAPLAVHSRPHGETPVQQAAVAVGRAVGDEERPQAPEEAARAEGVADRKSTRLNSSHQISSYAVCCLKKN